ncbi:MAG: PAS domain-containing protein [Betaproteobacteria bacterium]|nr:PAS domain-containing protein [Betaproteobacteria bacterium]
MNVQRLEKVKRQWRFAADAMPQLICLLDGRGRVLHVNRTLERWGLGEVGAVRGMEVHDLLHRGCTDAACHLRGFWQRTAAELAENGRAQCAIWDVRLGRHLEMCTQMPVRAAGQRDGEECFAVLTLDDVSRSKESEDSSRRAAQALRERAEREAGRRAEAERVRSHVFTILDKTPVMTAMADSRGVLFYLNPAGRSLMGLGEFEDVSALTLLECQAPGERARIAGEALPIAEREGVWSGDSVLRGRDARGVRSYVTLIAHRDEAGHLQGYSLLGRDMSEWVRTEEALRLTQNEVWRLSAQHLSIQESERRRIAVDLHDGLGQTLSLVKLSIEEAARSASSGAPGKVVQALERLTPQVKSALAELRRISMNLRPSTLDDLGILATLSWYCREFEAACPNVELERDVTVAEADVPQLLKIAIFRIVQEATSNALKHARAKRIAVRLHGSEGALALSIEDDGKGFDPKSVRADFEHGMGLRSMKERAELSGGSYEIDSAAGAGTRIRVRWQPEKTTADWTGLPAPAIQAVRQLSRADREMPERFSQCLACIKSLRSQ